LVFLFSFLLVLKGPFFMRPLLLDDPFRVRKSGRENTRFRKNDPGRARLYQPSLLKRRLIHVRYEPE
jgi:hypothetical protein